MVGVEGEDWISNDPITAARANQKCVTVKAAAPSALYDGMHWVDSDTNPPTVKWYDLTNTKWFCRVQGSDLAVLDSGTAYRLIIASDSTTSFTADRQLTIDLDNAARTLKMQGNLTVESASLVNQDLTSDASPTFATPTVTGVTIGANTLTTTEWALLDGQDQAVKTTSNVNFGSGTFSGAITATTLDTGQGANELYDMDQNVLTTSNVTFGVITSGDIDFQGNQLYGRDVIVESQVSGGFYIGQFSVADSKAYLFVQDYFGANEPTALVFQFAADKFTFESDGDAIFVGGLTISSTTDSSSKDTGAIICEGGMGIEKTVYIGVDLHVLGQIYAPSMAASDDLDDLQVIRNIRTIDGRIDASSLPGRFKNGDSVNVGSLLMLCIGTFKQLDARGVFA